VILNFHYIIYTPVFLRGRLLFPPFSKGEAFCSPLCKRGAGGDLALITLLCTAFVINNLNAFKSPAIPLFQRGKLLFPSLKIEGNKYNAIKYQIHVFNNLEFL